MRTARLLLTVAISAGAQHMLAGAGPQSMAAESNSDAASVLACGLIAAAWLGLKLRKTGERPRKPVIPHSLH